MSLKFTGTYEELQEKLSPLGGEWNDDQPNKKVFRLNGGVLNWFTSTGTLQFQGRSPGLEQLQGTVPHRLYPEEYEEQKTQVTQSEKMAIETAVTESGLATPECLYLHGKFQDTELVIGIVNAVGTEYKRVLEPLKDRLNGFGYAVEEIRVSNLLPAPTNTSNEYNRIKYYMGCGDELRNRTKNNAILAAGAAHKIT